MHRDHLRKTSACLRGGGESPCSDGQKVTVHEDKKSPSKTFCVNADGRAVGVKKRENLPTFSMNGPIPRIFFSRKILPSVAIFTELFCFCSVLNLVCQFCF